MALKSCSGSFAALSSLGVDFTLRHLRRRRRAAPVIIVPSFILSAYNSHHNSGAAAQNLSTPNVQHPAKVRDFMSTELQNVTVKTTAWRFQLRAGLSAIERLAQMHGEGSLRLH